MDVTAANHPSREDVESLRRTVDAMQRHLAAHDEMFDANGRVLDAFNRSLINTHRLIFVLFAWIVAAAAVGCVALVQR